MNALPNSDIAAAEPACRLCDGPTAYAFDLTLRGRYRVNYWQCRICGSLQTDAPYWLEETYKAHTPAHDTGMVARTLQMAQIASALLRVAGTTPRMPCLDFGGGNGLFCRMMRDQGYDFFSYDKYASPYYCIGFTEEPGNATQFDALTSFEVFEHLPAPHENLQEIVALKPRLWILSTQLYCDQNRDWNYLTPATGTHVFFYSEKGMRDFADRHGYVFMPGRHVHMFVRRADNPFLRSGSRLRFARQILAGGQLVTLATALHFAARQRKAYLRWQADRDALPAAL